MALSESKEFNYWLLLPGEDSGSGEDRLRTAEELGSEARGLGLATAASWRPLLHMGRGEEALTLGESADLVESDSLGINSIKDLMRAHLGQTAEA